MVKFGLVNSSRVIGRMKRLEEEVQDIGLFLMLKDVEVLDGWDMFKRGWRYQEW